MARLDASKISFEVDLIEDAGHLISFLEGVKGISGIHDPRVIARALYRYETFWLPLAAAHSEETLSAPPDIEWVWYSHMLSPGSYRRDCMAAVNTTISHTLVDQNQYKRNLSMSQKYWNQMHRERNEPFYIYYGAVHQKFSNLSALSFLVMKETERQKHFLHQVSLPHFRNRKYLEQSLMRYKKFLLLKAKFPHEVLVPCIDIALMWNAHKLSPVSYEKDLEKWAPGCLEIENEITYYEPGDQLVRKAFINTCRLWEDAFTEHLKRPGAMYRGYCTSESLLGLSEIDIYNICTKETNVKLNSMTLYLPQYATGEDYERLVVMANGSTGSENVCRWFTQKKIKKGKHTRVVEFHAPPEELWFSTRTVTSVRFELSLRLGHVCFGATDVLGHAYYDILAPVESLSFMSGGTFATSQKLTSDMGLDISGYFTPPIKGPAKLYLHTGEFDTNVDLGSLRQMFKTSGIQQLFHDSLEGFHVANHRVTNHAGKTIFTVTVTHSMPLLMSVIQITHINDVIVTAHLVSSEQLPVPKEVGDGLLSLDPRSGERAILIKNNIGDWAVVKGKWSSQEKETDLSDDARQARAAGTLHLTFYNIPKDETETASIDTTVDQHNLRLGALEANLNEGVVEIKDEATREVAEYVALTFAASLLHVLLVPHPMVMRTGRSAMPESSQDEGKTGPVTVESDGVEFFLASGLHCDVPSNQYIRERYGENTYPVYDYIHDSNGHVDTFLPA